MLKLITVLSEPQQRQLQAYLNQHQRLLQLDDSSYAGGRRRFWLQHRPVLGSGGRRYSDAPRLPQLWQLCRNIYQRAVATTDLQGFHEPHLGLAAYGAVGIRQHRDDPYAACPAVTINLSTEITRWGYTPVYSGYDNRSPQRVEEQIYHLPPGAIILFNSQNPHRVVSADPKRWSLNLWSISPKCRPYFQHYLAANAQPGDAVSFSPQSGEKIYGQQRYSGIAGGGSGLGLS